MKQSYFEAMSKIELDETQKDILISKLKSEHAGTQKKERMNAVSIANEHGAAVAYTSGAASGTTKAKTRHGVFGKSIAAIIAVIILGSLVIPIAIFFAGNGGQIAQIRKAFFAAKFAPNMEDVVPGFAFEQTDSNVSVGFAANGASVVKTAADVNAVSSDDKMILVSDTGRGPARGMTLSDEIAESVKLIEKAESTKQTVIACLKKTTEIGQWQHGGFRLDVRDDGTTEFRYKADIGNQPEYLVRLSADRTTVEISVFPLLRYNSIYTEYLRYDGEVFMQIDHHQFFDKNIFDNPTAKIVSSVISYREYRKAENGSIDNFVVNVDKDFDFDANNEPIGDGCVKTIVATKYGGDNSSVYRHGRQYEENNIVGDFHIENSKSDITIQDYSTKYHIMASANLFNIEKLFYSNEIYQANLNYNIYELTGMVLSDNTFITTVPIAGVNSIRGTISHYPESDIYSSCISLINVPSDFNLNEAAALYGLEFIDTDLDISDITDGKASEALDNIRISQIDELKNTKITFANSTVIYDKLYESFAAQFV